MYRRVLEAITKPPQLGIDTKISAITAVMTEIEKESRTLNSQRLHRVDQRLFQVDQRVDAVQREVRDIKGGVEGRRCQVLLWEEILINALASQNNQEAASLSVLKGLLLPDGHDPSDTLERYSSEVREAFKNPGRLKLLNVDQLMQETTFRQWEDSRKSCMMLLRGRTAFTARDYSYLSPATFHLIDLYRTQGRHVIFNCCHDRIFMSPDTPAHAVLSSLVYQMLQTHSSVLRDHVRFEDLRRRFAEPTWRSPSPKAAFAVLGDLLEMSPEVYILLDRVDKIKGEPDRFMDPLINLVKFSKCKLKVFLTSSSNHQEHPEGKMTPNFLENVKEELGPARFLTLALDQK